MEEVDYKMEIDDGETPPRELKPIDKEPTQEQK